MNLKAAYATVMVFIGCGGNVVFLELIVKNDPGAGNLITFLQFLFIALHGFIFTSKFGAIKSKIPIREYLTITSLFFITNTCNNYAFDFNIPMPLHMIFRAGSLITNMIMGVIVLQKKYKMEKYVSVLMITVGIIICTIISGADIKDTSNPKYAKQSTNQHSDFFWWAIGIALLTIALFISARMGIYQETLYAKYGKHPKEALYYTHLLPLPGFIFLVSNIWDHAKISSDMPTVHFGEFGVSVQWVLLGANILTQYFCISSVYTLTAECSSLTVTLVVTLRKFASLLFSIIYFRNPFTIYHWVGTFLVFCGTIIFTELIPNTIKLLSNRQLEKPKLLKNPENSELKSVKRKDD